MPPLRLSLIALNAAADLSGPVSPEPHDGVLTQSDDEKGNHLACSSREHRRRKLTYLRVMRTYPKPLEAHVRLRVEGKRNAERQRQDVVRDEVEKRAEVLTACGR